MNINHEGDQSQNYMHIELFVNFSEQNKSTMAMLGGIVKQKHNKVSYQQKESSVFYEAICTKNEFHKVYTTVYAKHNVGPLSK